jgi:hypothetical protein
MPAVDADELQNPFHRLQDRHVDVEVHSAIPSNSSTTCLRSTSATLCPLPGFNFSVGLPRMAPL